MLIIYYQKLKLRNLKQKLIEKFSKGGFNLHKWHSNIPSLENDNTNSEQIYTKHYSVVILVTQKS